MKIEFDEETFLDDDNSWSVLLVRIDDGDWHMTQPLYGTENKLEVTNVIYEQRILQLLQYDSKILKFALVIILISVTVAAMFLSQL